MVTPRIWFTAAQKAELWERWKNGQSAAAISRALERRNKTIERIVVLHGGIAPASRGRALAALRLEEREEISRGIAVGRSIRQIAQGLGRAPSTVSREIRHEAIYRSLFIQTRGVLKKELTAQLRTARRMRRPKSHNAKSGQGHILDRVSIRERPAEIEDRAVPGHWEGDLLTGANDTHIATLVERNTRFTMLVSSPARTRRLSLLRLPNTSASCLTSCDAP